MKKENKGLFGEEKVITEHLKEVGRLDEERELYRLVNIVNDIILKNTFLQGEKKEDVYSDIKRRLEIEYYKTHLSDLDPIEMYVWHMSVFSCLYRFQQELKIKKYDDKEQIKDKFEEIFEDEFWKRLNQLSDRNDISTLPTEIRKLDEIEVNESVTLYGGRRTLHIRRTKTSDSFGEITYRPSSGQKDQQPQQKVVVEGK